MQEVRRCDVDVVDYCARSKGVFLNRDEIDKIANTQTGYDEEHYRRYHSRDRDYHDYDDGYYHYKGHKKKKSSLAIYWILIKVRKNTQYRK
jgi:Zn-finger nucleic acid-binding protein